MILYKKERDRGFYHFFFFWRKFEISHFATCYYVLWTPRFLFTFRTPHAKIMLLLVCFLKYMLLIKAETKNSAWDECKNFPKIKLIPSKTLYIENYAYLYLWKNL